MIFLSGAERFCSDGRSIAQSMVGLLGAHSVDTMLPLPELGPRMAYVIRTMTARKYPADLLQRTVYPRNAEDMVYAFHPGRYPAPANARCVVESQKQPDVSFKCDMLDGLDALSIGIITSADLLKLPEDVKSFLQQLETTTAGQ